MGGESTIQNNFTSLNYSQLNILCSRTDYFNKLINNICDKQLCFGFLIIVTILRKKTLRGIVINRTFL